MEDQRRIVARGEGVGVRVIEGGVRVKGHTFDHGKRRCLGKDEIQRIDGQVVCLLIGRLIQCVSLGEQKPVDCRRSLKTDLDPRGIRPLRQIERASVQHDDAGDRLIPKHKLGVPRQRDQRGRILGGSDLSVADTVGEGDLRRAAQGQNGPLALPDVAVEIDGKRPLLRNAHRALPEVLEQRQNHALMLGRIGNSILDGFEIADGLVLRRHRDDGFRVLTLDNIQLQQR